MAVGRGRRRRRVVVAVVPWVVWLCTAKLGQRDKEKHGRAAFLWGRGLHGIATGRCRRHCLGFCLCHHGRRVPLQPASFLALHLHYNHNHNHNHHHPISSHLIPALAAPPPTAAHWSHPAANEASHRPLKLSTGPPLRSTAACPDRRRFSAPALWGIETWGQYGAQNKQCRATMSLAFRNCSLQHSVMHRGNIARSICEHTRAPRGRAPCDGASAL